MTRNPGKRIPILNPLFGKFEPARRTVAGDLGFGLTVLMTVAFLVLGLVNFVYSWNRDLQSLESKSKELAESATEVLASPVWNIDDREIQRIIGIYLQSDIITGAKLVDERGQLMIERWKTRETPRIELTRPVERNGAVIGKLTLSFSDAAMWDRQTGTLAFLAVALALAIAAVNIGTRRLMRRYLRDPLDRLIRGLDVIASGDYRFQLPDSAQEEVHRINTSVNSMALELKVREEAIDENRQRLEILNSAIMDIFSGPDTTTLIEQTLRSTVRLTRPSVAAFLPASTATDAPPARLFIAGQAVAMQGIDTTVEVEEAMAGIRAEARHRFALKSRHRHIGDFVIGFESPLAPQVYSLLKSLTSLATVAMIRQAFIRESAFMSAELKVAEGVQRSTVSGLTSSGVQADTAFHYEPVLRVGGDWTHVINDPSHDVIYVLMGDVTGHGIAQSMITTAVTGALESLKCLQSIAHGSSLVDQPSQILGMIARVVEQVSGDTNLQMTCVAAKLDFRERKITIANAGHQYPVLLEPSRSGTMRARALTGGLLPILGMNLSAKPPVADATFELKNGSRLVLFTDGLVDGRTSDGRTFHRQFTRCLGSIKTGQSSHSIRDAIVAAFRKHTAGGSVKDDVCLVVIGAPGESA
jgi:serine phosphatase RsbU (regulator of sigma subunit)/HAMP domain-containing protein